MSKSMNMLRQRRKDNNIKPNRRLDRKSSRGMIYENEELRLKTININAEIERGQSDIKKLRRENEMLKKEIWCLRDEYEKLDKLLKDKDVDFSSSTCTSDSESCSSYTEESEEVETSQNFENVQKTNLKNLHVEFDHLSVVPEENSTENSDKNSTSVPPQEDNNDDIIKPDQSYPELPTVKHFFSPLPKREPDNYFYEKTFQNQEVVPLGKSSSDVIVKMDNQDFNGGRNFNSQDLNLLNSINQQQDFNSNQNFNCGGNLEDLLNDIENISRDILKISTSSTSGGGETDGDQLQQRVPYKSELNVVLMPTPMPLLGFEKYETLRASMESLGRPKLQEQEVFYPQQPQPFAASTPETEQPAPIGFCYDGIPQKPETAKQEENCSSRSNLLELTSSDHVSSENEEIIKSPAKLDSPKAKSKVSIRRKISIFKGRKEKEKEKKKLEEDRKTPSIDSKKSTEDLSKDKKRISMEGKSSGSERNSQNIEKKNRKSVSVSPERKHGHHKKHKKVEKMKQRRSTISTDRIHRERSFSVCTDRSNFIDNKMALGAPFNADDYLTSDRERTNSLSSSGSIRMRKMSNISNFPTSGKIPWCGCWGNGCI